MNPAIDDLLSLLTSHKWVAAAALVIGLVVRLLKSDTKLPFEIPARYRVWLALGLGVVSGVLDKLANGTPWKDALLGGLVSGVAAIVGHEGLVESLRGGKELPIPGLTTPPDPDAGSKRAPTVPPLALLLLVLAFAPIAAGCGASLATVLGYVSTAAGDAQALLAFAKTMVDGYFSSHPNADAQAKANKGIAAAALALDAGLRALDGTKDATQEQTTAAFAQFAAAWSDLEQILSELGVFQVAHAPTVAARNAPALPVPLLVQRARSGSGARR